MSPFVTAIVFVFLGLQFAFSDKTWNVFRLLAPALAWGFVGYSLYLARSTPLETLPAIALFSVWASETAERRNLETLITYAPALLTSAFFTKDPMTAIVLIMASDALLASDIYGNLEEKHRFAAAKSLAAVMICMLPALIVVLLKLDSESQRVGIFATIALRVLYWPFTHWSMALPKSKGRNFFVVCSGGIACFALWRMLGPAEPVWALVMLVAAGVSTIGGRAWSAAILAGLAVFSLKEPWVSFVPAIWPLLWRGGRNRILLILLTAGFMAASAPVAFAVLGEPLNMISALLIGILVGRAFGAYFVIQATLWWELASVFTGLVLLALPFIFADINLTVPQDPAAIALAAALLIVGVSGWLFSKKAPRVFAPAPSFDLFQRTGLLVDRLALKPMESARHRFEMKDTVRLNRLIDHLDSDFSLVAIGLGVFAVWLLWSLQ